MCIVRDSIRCAGGGTVAGRSARSLGPPCSCSKYRPERRKLDWPFKPLHDAERAEGNPDKATPGRADVKP